jgi:hypothetical protein
MWVVSLLYTGDVGLVLLTLTLVLANALVCSYMFSKIGITNLPTAFVASSYFLVMSAIPQLHACWQGQVCVLGILVIVLLLNRAVYQRDGVEESFLSSVIVCLLGFLYPWALVLLPLMWVLLLIQRAMTLRVLLASLIGVLLVAIYAQIIRYLGWMDSYLSTFLELWSNWHIALAVGMWVLTLWLTYFPLKKESVATGIFYCVGIVLALAWGIITQIQTIL